jgi:hypothetical protein
MLRDRLAYFRFFCEPFSGHASDWMPSYLYDPQIFIDACGTRGNNIGFRAEAEGMFEREFAFDQAIHAFLLANFPAIVSAAGQKKKRSSRKGICTHSNVLICSRLP